MDKCLLGYYYLHNNIPSEGIPGRELNVLRMGKVLRKFNICWDFNSKGGFRVKYFFPRSYVKGKLFAGSALDINQKFVSYNVHIITVCLKNTTLDKQLTLISNNYNRVADTLVRIRNG